MDGLAKPSHPNIAARRSGDRCPIWAVIGHGACRGLSDGIQYSHLLWKLSRMHISDDIAPSDALIKAQAALRNIRETRWTFSDRPFAAFYVAAPDCTAEKLPFAKASHWRFIADTDNAWLDMDIDDLRFISLASGRYPSNLCATMSSLHRRDEGRPTRLRFLEIPEIHVNAVWAADCGREDVFHADHYPLDRSALKAMAPEEFFDFVSRIYKEKLAAYARAGNGVDLCG